MMKALRSAGLVWIAIGLASGIAHAQSAARGKFKLPYEVHWGAVTLASGEYSYSVEPAASGSVVEVASESNGKFRGMIMTSAWNPIAISSDNHLVVERQGGIAYVRSFSLGCIGAEYVYLPPKGKSGLLMVSKLIRRKPSGL